MVDWYQDGDSIVSIDREARVFRRWAGSPGGVGWRLWFESKVQGEHWSHIGWPPTGSSTYRILDPRHQGVRVIIERFDR